MTTTTAGRPRLSADAAAPGTSAVTGPGLLVLGMHRSGTSALTRALGLLGLETGRRGTLMEAAPSNRSGHWEISALTECNDELLRSAGGRWSGPPADLSGLDAAARGQAGADARALVADLLPAAAWTWKDPRLCLTLPFWRNVLGTCPPAVVCLRHPLEIAASLERRNGFAPAYGMALWERYLRSLWAHLAGQPVLVVDYDAVLAQPGDVIDALAAFVGEHAGVTPDGDARSAAAASLDQDERHHRADGAALAADPAVSDEQRVLYERSLALLGAHTALPADSLGPETPQLQLAFDEHARMSEFEDESLRLRAGMDEARAGLDRQTLFFHQELERRSAEASALATDVMDAREQIAELQASLDRIRRRAPIRAYLAVRRRLPGGGP